MTINDDPLVEALASSQRVGMLGARPIREVVAHADAFVEAIPAAARSVVDLGSGGGVPGLVVAWRRPDLEVVLVDRRATRTDQLLRLVSRLGMGERVRVLTMDADHLADELGAGAIDVVVARGFGPPLVTAACAAPLLRIDGVLVVSEPPASSAPAERWPVDALDRLGLRTVDHADPRVRVLRRTS
jgi:16S rRNA (guanine527-N7)-methyltransferase